MNNKGTKSFIKITSAFLICALLMLDIAWAGQESIFLSNQSDCLSPSINISQSNFLDVYAQSYNMVINVIGESDQLEPAAIKNSPKITKQANILQRFLPSIIKSIIVISAIGLIYFAPVVDVALLGTITGGIISLNILHAFYKSYSMKNNSLLQNKQKEKLRLRTWTKALIFNCIMVSAYIIYLVGVSNSHSLQKFGYTRAQITPKTIRELSIMLIPDAMFPKTLSQKEIVKRVFQMADKDFPYKGYQYDINKVIETKEANCLGKTQLVNLKLKSLGLNASIVYQYPYHYFVLVTYPDGKSQVIDSSKGYLSFEFDFRGLYKAIGDGYFKYDTYAESSLRHQYSHFKVIKSDDILRTAVHIALASSMMGLGWDDNNRFILESALNEVKEALKNNDSFEARMIMGRLYWKLDDLNNARINFIKAKELVPDYFEEAARSTEIRLSDLENLMRNKSKIQKNQKRNVSANEHPLPQKKDINTFGPNSLIYQSI